MFRRCRVYFGPTCLGGTVLLGGDRSTARLVNILRDTGCVQALTAVRTLLFNNKSSADADIHVRDIVGTDTALLHFVELVSDLFTGSIRVGVRDSLSISGDDMLIGNELSDANVSGDLVAVASPERLDSMERVEDA